MKSSADRLSGWYLGATATQFETAGKGVFAVSSGKGDNGGASYGAYQLSTSTGTLRNYLNSPAHGGYGRHFNGLSPGTAEFKARWLELAKNDPAFASTQYEFIRDTHYKVQLQKLSREGMDLSGRGKAIQDMVWSTSVQFGGATSIVTQAIRERYGAGVRIATISDADIITAVQDYKYRNNDTLFRKSSEAVRAGTLGRAPAEKAKLLELLALETAGGSGLPGSDSPAEPYQPLINASGTTMCTVAVPGVDVGYSWCVINEEQAARTTVVLRNESTGNVLASVCTEREILAADSTLLSLYRTGQLDAGTFRYWSDWSTSRLVSSALTMAGPLVRTDVPIGAFYESRSIASDPAASIADRVFRVVDAAGRSLTEAQLLARDVNRDARLSGSELTGLFAWQDLNEDGVRQAATETVSLAAALSASGQSTVRTEHLRILVAGHSEAAMAAQTSDAILLSLAAQTGWNNSPASAYAQLRTTDNRFDVGNGSWIDWSPTQIKLTSDCRSLVGTDAAEQFDIGYYRQYDGRFFSLSQVTRFYAGGGDDLMGGSVRSDSLWGGDGSDTLLGYEGNDCLFGETGNDQLVGADGNDILLGASGDDLLTGNQGNDSLAGGTGHDELQAGDGADVLLGDSGDDRLFGQAGNDTLYGGEGNDLLMGFTGTNESQQTLLQGQTDDDMLYGLDGDDVLISGPGHDLLYGGAGADELQAGDGADRLYGESGNDRLFGQVGNDVLYGGSGDDLLVGFTGQNESRQALLAGETDDDCLYGGAGSDSLLGGIGRDWLDGGAGADVMEGGAGDDVYVVNSVNDVILERPGEGLDTVVSSVSCILSADVESLRLLEGASIHGTGNRLNNQIVGNAQNNILDGVTGVDTLTGGAGDDVYYVDNARDMVIEWAGEGIDTLCTSVSYTLAANTENLTLLDFSKPERGLADGRPILVYGYPKANELDYMQGNAVVGFRGTCALTSISNLATQVRMSLSEGDVVSRAIDNQWCEQGESLTEDRRGGSNAMQQMALLDSYGIRNEIVRGYSEESVANLIKGGRGVIIALNAGALWNDADWRGDGSANHVVTVTGVACDEAHGGISGFYIADSGRGLVSDMTRYVAVADFRAAAQVSDAYAIYTLEPLKLWDEDIDAVGNGLANVIHGNRGNNRITGGRGADTLCGGAGNDTYLFARGDGFDTVMDRDETVGNIDTAQFQGIRQTQLWFQRTGSDLRISVLGSPTDRVTIKDWYASGEGARDHQIERFVTSDGLVMHNTDVDAFVHAMAAFGGVPSGQSAWRPGETRNGQTLMTVNH